MSGLQGRDYIREVERPLEEVGDVGTLPNQNRQPVSSGELEKWKLLCADKDKRITELEKELASVNSVKLKELREDLKHAEKRAQELHLANITRPETELIAKNVMAIMMAICNLPEPPLDPLKDDRRRQIIVGVQELGQQVLSFCGSACRFPAAREAYQLALRAFYGNASERDLEFLKQFGLIYHE